MPTYEFLCVNCGHLTDQWMKFSDYEKCSGKIICSECNDVMKRLYSGRQNAPAIKTITRLEDLWKKHGILDPEDPGYARQNKDRVKEMRKRSGKELDEKISRGELEIRSRVRVEGKGADEKFTKEDIEKLPDKSKGKVSINKDGSIKESTDD